jgi:hypothetical protein
MKTLSRPVEVECPRCIGYKLQISRYEEDIERKRSMNTRLYNDYEKARMEVALLTKEVKDIIRATGGHWCQDWDYDFILPGSKESSVCSCGGQDSGALSEDDK